jgi:H+/gluconate symporter and related permeases
MSEFLIIFSLAFLIYLAYKGLPVILFAPFCAILAAVTTYSPAGLLPAYTTLYLPKMGGFVTSNFPIFLFGAVFGKIMEETGQAKSISKKIIETFGAKYAIIAVGLSAGVLAYGGISVYVVVFAVYAFGCKVFREANIPKRLLPATIIWGSWTWAMDTLPGTPQIQNILPTKLFGTTAYAAPVLSIVGAILLFALGYVWLHWRLKQAAKNGEGYGNHTLNEPIDVPDENLPPFKIAIIPMIVVFVLNYILTQIMVNWNLADVFGKSFPNTYTTFTGSIAMWAATVAIISGIIVALAISWKNLKKSSINVTSVFYAGTLGAILAVMNTAAEVGFGGVISALPGFSPIAHAAMNINAGGSPLLALATSQTIISGVTGSAAGGLGLNIEILGQHFAQWGQAYGMNPGVMHRIMAMASGGFDTLPHNGAIVTLLAYTGLTHKQAYLDIFGLTLTKLAVAYIMVGIASMGLVF